MRRRTFLPALGLAVAEVVGLANGTVLAQQSSFPEPNTSSVPLVTPEAGAWMICAASYTGPEAQELARLIAMHLRTQHNYPSYLFSRSNQQKQQIERELNQMQQSYPEARRRHRTVRIEEQWAVLIGGFKDMASASAALPRVKQLPLPNVQLRSGKPAFDVYADFSASGDNGGKAGPKRIPINPFSTSFVIPNPSVPQGPRQFTPDPAWKQFNAGEEYSLLNCRGQLTLLVKDYQGASVIQTGASQPAGGGGFLDKLGLGSNRPGDALDAAARQAHEIARVLRQLGFEAYVLHMRGASLVSVGSFQNAKDPELAKTLDRLGRFSLGPTVQLYRKPVLMPVPKF